MRFKRKSAIFRRLLGVVLVVALIVVVVNHQTVSDFVRGAFYTPSERMLEIRDGLGLSGKGALIFNASRPELNNEQDFNANCLSFSDEDAILGCYKGQRIYVYVINSEELDGIMELATAHELLHAVYERMPIWERDRLRKLLEAVYKNSRDILEKEIESYSADEQMEELYVRIGTEIKKLPDTLEEHYAQIFKDQDRIVDYYEKYIGVFRRLEAEFKTLEAEMEELKGQIDAKSAEYKIRSEQLNSSIYEFNNCANRANCFGSEAEFNAKRRNLLSTQAELKNLYDEIDSLINQYNSDVEKYNSTVVRSKNLQNIINSHVVVEGI